MSEELVVDNLAVTECGSLESALVCVQRQLDADVPLAAITIEQIVLCEVKQGSEIVLQEQVAVLAPFWSTAMSDLYADGTHLSVTLTTCREFTPEDNSWTGYRVVVTTNGEQ